MREFLKEYHLYDDIRKLNSNEYFMPGFKIQDLDDIIGATHT